MVILMFDISQGSVQYMYIYYDQIYFCDLQNTRNTFDFMKFQTSVFVHFKSKLVKLETYLEGLDGV